jgi:hypothetical protein
MTFFHCSHAWSGTHACAVVMEPDCEHENGLRRERNSPTILRIEHAEQRRAANPHRELKFAGARYTRGFTRPKSQAMMPWGR